MEKKIRNAVIEYATLGWFDGREGMLTAYIGFDFGDGTHRGWGGYSFDGPVKRADGKIEREGSAWGMEYIRRILEVLEVESWEKLKGTPVRVIGGDFGASIVGVGHFTKDKRFEPETDLAHFLKNED